MNEPVYDLDAQLAELRARVARAQLLLRVVTAGLLLAIAGIAVLMFFPEWLPGRWPSSKAASPGASRSDPTLEVLKDVRDLSDYLHHDLDDVRLKLKTIVDANLKSDRDSLARNKQLNQANEDLRKELIKATAVLKQDLTKLAEDQRKPAENKKKKDPAP